ncbi:MULTISPECIES: nuclear transport factor 2 family protein [Nguyenibacter]|uniref:Nuclear transport factor 2 family protein n=1 Tax=Nguyenibacter vanlangensis TaxID=1216886 RepID=A0A7Y7IT39_9PROT|nr:MULTISPECIES: nuclear transport factor 2 family protein [Nguyenibacter]NVN09657.1 nuclear transport factor 2 family protein [Nguyenibacter vanlangensis]WRH87161.1 nuclear transport factor 2 family protein [Nguyenibacter sp. L1]
MTPTSCLPDWFEQALEGLRAGDIGRWMTIYAPEAVHEFPFAPEGAPRELVGRDAIAVYMSRLPSLLRFGALSDVRARVADDELIVEATGHHRRVADDAVREISYVWFIKTRDGKVVHFRDYMNPRQLSSIVAE